MGDTMPAQCSICERLITNDKLRTCFKCGGYCFFYDLTDKKTPCDYLKECTKLDRLTKDMPNSYHFKNSKFYEDKTVVTKQVAKKRGRNKNGEHFHDVEKTQRNQGTIARHVKEINDGKSTIINANAGILRDEKTIMLPSKKKDKGPNFYVVHKDGAFFPVAPDDKDYIPKAFRADKQDYVSDSD